MGIASSYGVEQANAWSGSTQTQAAESVVVISTNRQLPVNFSDSEPLKIKVTYDSYIRLLTMVLYTVTTN